MRRSLPHLATLALLILSTGCATSVDMDSMNRRIDDNAARIAAMEKAQSKQSQEEAFSQSVKLQALQKEIEALRKDFADSKWTVDNLAEKVESFAAYVAEVDEFMVQFKKRGGEIDKTLEELTTKLEADVRGLAEKLKQMLEQESR